MLLSRANVNSYSPCFLYVQFVPNSGNFNDVSTSYILINGRPTRTFSGWSHLLLHTCTNAYLGSEQSDNNLLPAVAADMCNGRPPLCHTVSKGNELRQRNIARGKLMLLAASKGTCMSRISYSLCRVQKLSIISFCPGPNRSYLAYISTFNSHLYNNNNNNNNNHHHHHHH